MNKKSKNYFVEAEVEIPYFQSEIRNKLVKAENKEEAIKLYQEELIRDGISVCSNSVSPKTGAAPGIVFFAIVLIMSYFRYFEKDGFNYVSLYPNVMSILLSILVYSSFVIKVKGIEKTFKNFPDTVISLLFILVFAIFIKIFAKDSSVPAGVVGKFLVKLGLGNSYILILLAIVLSWLGVKQICGFIWVAIIGLGLAELVTCGNYLGDVKGSIFLLSSFCGFVFYLKYEGKVIINSFKKLATTSANFIQSDIEQSRRGLQTAIHTVPKKSERIKIENNEVATETEAMQ